MGCTQTVENVSEFLAAAEPLKWTIVPPKVAGLYAYFDADRMDTPVCAHAFVASNKFSAVYAEVEGETQLASIFPGVWCGPLPDAPRRKSIGQRLSLLWINDGSDFCAFERPDGLSDEQWHHACHFLDVSSEKHSAMWSDSSCVVQVEPPLRSREEAEADIRAGLDGVVKARAANA